MHRRAGFVLYTVVLAAIVALTLHFATDRSSSHSSSQAGTVSLASNAAFSSADACISDDTGRPGPGHHRFLLSACENAARTVVTLPLHKGTSGGQTVYYVMMDSSNQAYSAAHGLNFAPKLANAIGSTGVQKVTMNGDGTIDFPATVDFHHTRVLVPGPNGFPPTQFAPSAVGNPGYSPLIELPNGIVVNAPQIANHTGQAIKIVKLDTANLTVMYDETQGRYESKHVHYASFDSSSPLAATIEKMTYAPALAGVPGQGNEGMTTSARETLMAFVNGPADPTDPERQGLNQAILNHQDPFNVLHETPTLPGHVDVGDVTYSPMWDVHLVAWTPFAINAGDRVEVRGFTELAERLSTGSFSCMQGTQQCQQGLITGAGGKVLTPTDFVADGASGFVVNCPLISIDLP